MKKLPVYLFLILSLFFTACSGDQIDGQTSWKTQLEEGRIQAQEQNKSIMLVVTADEDGYSQTLKNDIFYRHSFVEKYTKDYVLVNFDFTASEIEQAFSEDDSDKLEIINANMNDASLYGIQMTPSVLLLSKEGFYITQIYLNSETVSVKAFNSLMDSASADIKKFYGLLDTVNSSEENDRLNAIDALYEATDEGMRHMLRMLCAEYLSLDPDNTTQKCFKYLSSQCDFDARSALFQRNYKAAAECYSSAAANSYVTPEEKQILFYQCGFLLSSCGYTEYGEIKKVFESALKAAPESANAPSIRKMISSVDERIKIAKENN